MEKYIDLFINKLGNPTSLEKLSEYISFCINNECERKNFS
jgi:hypothetical protein